MKVPRNARFLAVLLATLNWVLPIAQVRAWEPPARTAAPPPPVKRAQINDIALGAGGELRGRVLDIQGRATDAYQVIVIQDGRQVGTVAVDKQGSFATRGLRGGMFQVAVAGNLYACRGWVQGTAPPAAVAQLLVVPAGVVERGQRPISDLFFADPVMIGLVIAAAIAIPIAVSNSRSERPPGS